MGSLGGRHMLFFSSRLRAKKLRGWQRNEAFEGHSAAYRAAMQDPEQRRFWTACARAAEEAYAVLGANTFVPKDIAPPSPPLRAHRETPPAAADGEPAGAVLATRPAQCFLNKQLRAIAGAVRRIGRELRQQDLDSQSALLEWTRAADAACPDHGTPVRPGPTPQAA